MKGRTVLKTALVSLVWVLLTVIPGQAQGPGVDVAELQKFQGSWVLIAGEKDGKQLNPAHVKQSSHTIMGNKIEVFSPHQHKDKILATITKLDSTKNPKEMHWVRSTGPNVGTAMMGIYEFEGLDRYKICFDPASRVVPQKFVTSPGSGLICHTWRRVKP
jgi:uncharacterized protein (TIGR03067 family)